MTDTPNQINPTLRQLLDNAIHHRDELEATFYRLSGYLIEKNPAAVADGQTNGRALQLSDKLQGDVQGLAHALDLLVKTIEAEGQPA